MANVSSKLTVKVDVQGDSVARKQIDGMHDAHHKGAKRNTTSFQQAARELQKLNKVADALIGKFDLLDQVIGNVGNTAKVTGSEVRRVLDGTGSGGTAKGGKKKAAAEAAPSSPGAFLHGLLQGSMPGPLGFIQRGPGAMAQGAGMMAGNVLSSLLSIPFTGSGGLMNAASGLGSIVAAPLSRYMGMGSQAVDFRRAQQQMAPFLSNAQVYSPESMVAANRLTEPDIAQRVNALPNRLMKNSWSFSEETAAERKNSYRDKLRGERRDLMMSSLRDLSESGRNLMGVSYGEQQQFMAEIARSGASTSGMAGTRFGNNAMAAQTMFGISPSTSGAFAYAARAGMYAGGPTDSSENLLAAINQGRGLNFEGQDLVEYVQEMANEIRQARETGITIHRDSLATLTRGMTGLAGMDHTQGLRAARGLLAGSQAFYNQDISSPMMLRMYQNAGYKGGLGSQDEVRFKMATDPTAYGKTAMAQLEETRTQARKLKLPYYTQIAEVQQAASSLGISKDPLFAQKIVDTKGKLTESMLARMGVAPTNALAENDLQGRASGRITEHSKRAADQSNQSTALGMDAALSSQALEAAANDVASVTARYSSVLVEFSTMMAKTVASMSGGGASYRATGGT